MGCDLHLHAEIKFNGQWHHYAHRRPSRNYQLFALLAGVRNYDEITPIASPRGIPKDATAVTKFDKDHMGNDGHSHSWISAKEILQVAEFAKAKNWASQGQSSWWESDEFGYLFGNNFSGFEKWPTDRPEGLEDVRFVFWFDN